MSDTSFRQAVLKPLQKLLHHPRLMVPSAAAWRFNEQDSRIESTVPATALGRNLQGDAAATPVFALCLAYWLELLFGTPITARVVVSGPCRGASSPHQRRSAFMLDHLEVILGHRFEVQRSEDWSDWTWATRTVVNHAITARGHSLDVAGHEHRVERAFTRSMPAVQFSSLVEPIDGIRRQLPSGLFSERVARRHEYTPRGASQVDLWAWAEGSRTFHLFELKAMGNCKLGILPEALWYALLWNYVRMKKIDGNGTGVETARQATRVHMWLLVPEVARGGGGQLTGPYLHPLVGRYIAGEWHWIGEWLASPLEAIGVRLGILTYREEGDAVRLEKKVAG